MRGKYSPTVTAAYMQDQNWHYKLRLPMAGAPEVLELRDPDGYDSYGYDEHDVDRAGNHENDYACDDTDEHGDSLGFNSAYDQALSDWGFDGVRPVKR